MQRIVEDFRGEKKEVSCLGCYTSSGGKDLPGYIVETDYFHAHQDHEVPIPGFIILTAKRHIESMDQFTDEEAADFIALVRRIRQGMREVLNIHKIYFVQEEDTEDHFHLWFFPLYDWMKELNLGRKSSAARPLMKYARENMKTPENLTAVMNAVEKLRRYLK